MITKNPKSYLDLLSRKPRTKQDMIAYLSGHFRYHTMNSWNRATSYAHNIKVSHLNNLDKEVGDKLYDLINVSDSFDESGYNSVLREFDRRHNHYWQIGTNGRSGGYLVLYQGGQKTSQYRSYCTACGQRNFTAIVILSDTPEDQVKKYIIDHPHWREDIYLEQAEVVALGVAPERVREIYREVQKHTSNGHLWLTTNNVCGVCHQNTRVNYAKPPMETFSYPGKGLDMDRDFEDWDTSTLRDRVEIIWDFDQTCERAVAAFVDFAKTHHVEEEEIQVTKKILVTVED